MPKVTPKKNEDIKQTLYRLKKISTRADVFSAYGVGGKCREFVSNPEKRKVARDKARVLEKSRQARSHRIPTNFECR